MTELENVWQGSAIIVMTKFFWILKVVQQNLLKKYNALEYEQKEEKENILKELFGEIRYKGISCITVSLRLWAEYSCGK